VEQLDLLQQPISRGAGKGRGGGGVFSHFTFCTILHWQRQ
jgi:hypothetical protein